MLDDSLQVISREKNEEKKKNETVSGIYTTLPLMVQESKHRIVAERNMLQANEVAAKFDIGAIFSGEGDIDAVRPKNIVRHLEKAMQSF